MVFLKKFKKFSLHRFNARKRPGNLSHFKALKCMGAEKDGLRRLGFSAHLGDIVAEIFARFLQVVQSGESDDLGTL